MKRRRFLVLIIASALLLFGCQLVNLALQSGSGFDRSETIFLSGSQPRTLDPATTLGGPDSALGHIFSGLVTLDTDLQIQPDLAGGWDVSADGRVYTFFLRENAVFHDGRSVTADDVIYSWERAADPATGSDTVLTYLGDIDGVAEKMAGEAAKISGLRALDDHTLEVRLREPVVYFLAKLAYPVAFVVDQANVAQPDWERQPNGTGPFTLETWRDDDVIVLARNEVFYNQPAFVQHVVFDLGANLPLSQYETGEIDLVGVGGGSLERVQDPNSPLNADLRTVVDMCTQSVGLNNQLPPFDDVRVRQAFNYALDKERLLQTFSNGNALIADGPLPPGMPGFGGLDGPSYPFDPQKARQLLAEAGYADPADLGTLIYSTAGYGDVGEFVTAVITLWQETLGVTIEPVLSDPFTYYDELFAGKAGHFYATSWCADYPDPQNFLDILYHSESTQNIGRFSDPQVDALLEAARVETGVNQRIGMYQETERQLVTQAPVVFVSHGASYLLVSPDLQGYVLTPLGVAQWHRVKLNR